MQLGGLPCTNFEYELVQRELRLLEMELEKLECQLDSTGKSSLLDKTRMKLSLAELKLKQLESELADLRVEAEEQNTGRLECGVAYPGTEISFGEETLRLRHEDSMIRQRQRFPLSVVLTARHPSSLQVSWDRRL